MRQHLLAAAACVAALAPVSANAQLIGNQAAYANQAHHDFMAGVKAGKPGTTLVSIAVRLDVAIANQQRVIDELHALDTPLPTVSVPPDAPTPDGAALELANNSNVFEKIVYEGFPKHEATAYADKAAPLVKAVAKGGWPYFSSFIAGSAIELGILRKQKASDQAVSLFSDFYRQELTYWDGQVKALIAQDEAAIAANMQTMKNGIGHKVIGHRFDEDGACRYNITDWVDVSGDYDAGFSGKAGNDAICEHFPFPNNHTKVPAPPVVTKTYPTPQGDTGMPVVDVLIHLRNATITLTKQHYELAALETQIASAAAAMPNE